MSSIHSLNMLQLIGNVGREPEFKEYGEGKRLARFSVATSESWKSKQTGEWEDTTEWHTVVVFNEHMCNVVEKFITVGTMVYVSGPMKYRSWKKEGEEKPRIMAELTIGAFDGEIKVLKKLADTSSAGSEPGSSKTSNDVMDEDIPF